jgi:hypothetical protein
MSIFDIFSTGPSQQAAAAQTAGLNAGYNQASGNINQAIGALNQNYGQAGQQLQTNYTSALAPYLQNYGQAQGGVNQLENLLGINGAGGSAQAQHTLTNMPGYQFALQQGQNATNAAAQAGGTGQSGNQLLALQQQGQGLASQNYNQYVSQLQPFLSASNAAAGGINSTYTGLGQGLAANSQGLGQGLAGQYGNLASLGWQQQTGIGNANANADLSAYNASANILGALGGLFGGGAKAGASGAGSSSVAAGQGAGNAVSGLSNLFGAFLAEGGEAEADRPYVVGEPRGYADKLQRFMTERESQPDWFDRLHARLQREADDAVAQRLDARTYEDMAGVDRPYKPAPERAPLSLRYPAFQSGGYPPVGDPAYVGDGAPPKPELFVPHDGSPPEWLGLDGPEVIVPQKPGTVVPNHGLLGAEPYLPSPYTSLMAKFMPPGGIVERGAAMLPSLAEKATLLPGNIARGAIEESSKIGTPEQNSYDPSDVLTGASLGVPGLASASPRAAAQGLQDILRASPTATKAAAAGGAGALGLGSSSTQSEAEEKINPQVLELEQLRRQAESPDPRSEQVDSLNKRAAAQEQAAAQSKYRSQGDIDRAEAKRLQAQADELSRQIQADKSKAVGAYQSKLNEIHTAEVAAAADEAQRLKDMPTAEQYPAIGLAARTIATLAAAIVPYVHRNWVNGQLNEHVTGEVKRLIRRAKGATSAGDVKELNRTIVALQKLKPRAAQVESRWAAEHGQPSRSRAQSGDFMRNFVLPGAGWGGLNVEAGMVPYQADYFSKPEDSAAHRNAVRNMMDPERMALDMGRGFTMRALQSEVPPYTALERPNMHDLEAIIKRVRSKKPALTVAP